MSSGATAARSSAACPGEAKGKEAREECMSDIDNEITGDCFFVSLFCPISKSHGIPGLCTVLVHPVRIKDYCPEMKNALRPLQVSLLQIVLKACPE